jgi:cobalt-zinc-cadmium resistance protein CzcA
MMLKGANSADVVSRIKDKMATIQKSLPKDVVIEPYLDRTDLEKRAISTVEKNLIEGALIVIFVLVLFLGNLRAGLIVASAIPLSMLFALGLMNVFGVSANLMSLGAIDFGLIVDGAVIIVEATLHHLGLRSKKWRRKFFNQHLKSEAAQHLAKSLFSSFTFLFLPLLALREKCFARWLKPLVSPFLEH